MVTRWAILDQAGLLSSFPQVTKATGKFLKWGHTDWQFDDWNRWRMRDGMLCRTTADCSWLDRNLLCQDYKLDISISQAWFGGNSASIRGECQCGEGMEWNKEELQCEKLSFSVGLIILSCLIGLVALVILCALCCCTGILGSICCCLCQD